MDRQIFDVVVIGAGIAGATTAAALAPTHRVALLEAEAQPGYHSTGRSAAIWVLNYGPPAVRRLSWLSRPFFEHPPPGFSVNPLLRRRGFVFLAPPEQKPRLDAFVQEGQELRLISIPELRALVPALRPEYAVAAAIEDNAFDMDVAAIHQGFLRQVRAHGGVLITNARTERIERRGGLWQLRTSADLCVSAGILVDAAGAWGDVVAKQAGVRPLGLTPCRRTAAIIDPAPWDVEAWPRVGDVDHTWYVRPEARSKLLVTPADETPMPPHDVQPEEIDIALGIDRMQQALDIPVQRVEHAWAGLRTFTPDRNLAIGWDPAAHGFFWCVGQGGYGIQTSPAAGRLAADLIAGRDPGEASDLAAALDPRRFGAAN
ncbi:MAG: FAD-binding oxidoreductase [Acetobacteraceae bacterium]|nr:FAD-binding oxidoreductase [Acetobacteraceae bacterium]